MHATYEIRWGQADSTILGSKTAHDYESALEIAPIACIWPLAVIHDGWMTLHRWEAGTEVKVRHETDGHRDGCGCGQCGTRAAYLAGEHDTAICRHKTCRKCGTCGTSDPVGLCEQAIRDTIKTLTRWERELQDAHAAAAKARNTLTWVQGDGDHELNGTAGDDASAEFTLITRSLRNLLRIARTWLADAETESPVPSIASPSPSDPARCGSASACRPSCKSS